MKYQAVKSFNDHESGIEGRVDFDSLSDALSYIRNTAEGYLWARKEVVVGERIGNVVRWLSSRDAAGMTKGQVLEQFDKEFTE